MLHLIPGKPHSLGLEDCPEATAPPLRASCPLQYEAVMDRVQKSKLSLYKKVMEVGARLLGHEGSRAQGVGPRRPGMGTWERAALDLYPGTSTCSGLHWVPKPHMHQPRHCSWETLDGWAGGQSQTVAHSVIHAVSCRLQGWREKGPLSCVY